MDRARMDDEEVPFFIECTLLPAPTFTVSDAWCQVSPTVLFSKFQNNWIYVLPVVNPNPRALKSIEVFSIALVSKTFDPEKHGALAKIMSQASTRHCPSSLRLFCM